MLVPYVRPQDTITQILQQTAVREQSRRNPIVIGPQFNLYLNDGRDLEAAKLDFSSAGAVDLPYQDGAGVDLDLLLETPSTDDAELFGEGLEALVATFASDTVDIDTTDTTWRTVRTASGDLFFGDGTLHTILDGRQVRIGDVLESDWNDDNGGTGTTRRKVVAFKGKITPAVAAGSLVKSAAPTNAADTADASFLLAGLTTAGYTIDSFTVADNQHLRDAGKTYTNGSGDILIGDELTISVTGAGDNTTAAATITSKATGTTAAGVVSASGGAANLFEFDLAAVGYTAGDEVTLDHTGDLSAGDVIVLRLFPAYTAPDLGVKLTVAGEYTGAGNLRYVIEVLTLDPDGLNGSVKIYDTAGVEAVTTNSDPAAGGVPLGALGLTFDLDDDAGLYVGQKLYIDAVAAIVSPTEFDGLVLDGPVVPSNTMATYGAAVYLESVKVYQVYTGVLGSENLTGGVGNALITTDADWDYAAALGLPETETGRTTPGLSPFLDGEGKVFLSYKSIVTPSDTESLIELDSETKILSEIGETDQGNWLGRGALEAFRGNQNQVVYALRTAGDTVDDFAAALNKIRTTDQVYALVPMTDSLEVKQLVKDHCVTQSNKFNKNFRRCYVGTDSPGSYEHWGLLDGGGYRTAELDSSLVTLDDAYTDSWKFTSDDVGATVTILALGLTFEILEIISDSEVRTDAASGLTTGGTPSGIIVTRPDTPEATALYVRNQSKALADRRCVNVWCHNPTVVKSDGSTEVLQNKFVAAEIAGLRCALLPQQGLTLTELLSIGNAPGMYATFTPELLDDIAADGTMVITQETEGGDIFIRHQLTTKVENDGALAYEDNVGVIVDDFSYAVKDTFRSYIGGRNATPDTIAEIDDQLKSIASDFTEAELVNADIGPAVLAFFDEKGNEGEVTVRQDGDLADTLMTYVKLRVPLPINGINHYVDVEVTEVLASEDN